MSSTKEDQGQSGRSALGRRSSFEAPPKMSLGDLPPPSFSAIAAGQRSVPALERQSAMFANGQQDLGTPSGTLTPGASGPLGLNTDPWTIFGSDNHSKLNSSANAADNWSNRVKSSTWNEDSNGSVGQAVGGQRRTASNHTDNVYPEEAPIVPAQATGLARSSSYSGDLNKRRVPQEGEAPEGTSSLKRTGSQKERNASTLAQLTSSETSQPAVRFNEASLSQEASTADQSAYDAQDSPRQSRVANGSRLASNVNSRSASPEVDLVAGMRNMRFTQDQMPNQQQQQQMPQQQQQMPAANGWPQGGLKSNNVFGAPDQLYSAFYSGPSFGQPASAAPFNAGLGGYGEQAYPNMNFRRDSGFALTPSVGDMYGLNSPGPQQQQQNGNAGMRRAQSAWPMENNVGGNRPVSRSPTYGFAGGMSRSSSAQYGPSGTDPSFYSGGLAGGAGFNGYPPYTTGLVTANGGYGDPYGGMVGGMRYEDRMRGLRSPLLEEFRANRHRRWDLTDIRGYIVEFSSDQLGSRHLQQKLDNASFEERQMFFDEILPNILQLSTDLFSNYVVQKAFEIADHSQKLALVKAMEGHILQLSLQMYGCRVIQKAIEHVFVDEQVAIVKELEGNILKCARDQNANHVLQRILERVPADRIRSIPDACEGQIYALATHPYGCRVLQRILENLSEVRSLIEELLKYTQNLMQDQYSNYVIQHLLERGTTADRSAIISHVRGQLVALSRHKFASNVIDKVILCASEEERRSLTDEILYDPANISIMLKDQYANYCLQKFMLVVQGPQREPLISRVAEALLNIRKYSGSYSKHLMAIERFISAERSLGWDGGDKGVGNQQGPDPMWQPQYL